MNNKKTHVIKGLIIGLLLIVYSIVIYMTGQFTNKTLGYISYLILIVGLIVSGIQFSKENQGNVTFGNVFAHCFRANAVVTILVIIWTILAVKVIFPDMEDQMITLTRKEMEKGGKYTDEQISQGLAFIKKTFFPLMIGSTLFGYAIFGAIGSLLGAAFAKKNAEVTQPSGKA